MADLLSIQILREAESMRVFADGGENFCYGHWKEWKRACMEQQRTIPPSEFKAELAQKDEKND